jgi:hypothetical protein
MLSLWKSGKVFALSAAMFSAGVGVTAATLAYLPRVSATPEIVAGGVKQSKAEQVIEYNGLKWELQNCQRGGQRVICNFLITNIGQEDNNVHLSTSSRIFDLSGNEYSAKETQVGKNNYSTTLIRGIPTKASISFELPREITKFAVLEVNTLNDGTIKFRDVNISGSQVSNPTASGNECTCPPQTNPKKPVRARPR